VIGYVYLDIDDPLVAWMTYRAELVSASQVHKQAISFWSAGRLTSRAQFDKELTIERIRETCYPSAVSRLAGFYAFPDLASAQLAASRWKVPHFRSEWLAEIEINPASRTSRYDAEWITQRFGSLDTDWTRDYFEGKATAGTPIWELVIDGRALILGTELRRAAYAVVKEHWPGSLAFLEFGRLGVELSSDMGLITPMVTLDGSDIVLTYHMNMVDAENPEFLARLKKFSGPINHQDLMGADPLIAPDLRSRFVNLA
jgi:hypothetical protein